MPDTDRSSSNPFDRRTFLTRTAAGLSAAWLTSQWPAMVSAATHAHSAVANPAAAKFEFFKPEEAAEVEAIASRIIPSDETPGAKEAGVVYFIDRALVTFASDSQSAYREGLEEIRTILAEKFPGATKFSSAPPEQQDAVLEALSSDNQHMTASRRNRPNSPSQPFFETIRYHTIAGFLIDPDSGRRGNKDGVGWKVIGRENSHIFQAPFGDLDKNYPGWQPVDSEKK
ncbi:MAG: gluconate 2-dehydrogenase subunit 3 family protein [Acidobacteria bacterium]|nr:gluconate 2-dehydrogenase subunit 3 family protein [Acidobacteriota bacterium]MBS1866427.1 gluconate 2-dehydrogenase subunit 3 family protein [Acidobacteriota bacterium]